MKASVLTILILLFISSSAFAESDLYSNAVTAYKRGDFVKTNQLLKKYIQQKPDASAYYLLGYALYMIEKYPESFRYFKEAYMIDPNISMYFSSP